MRRVTGEGAGVEESGFWVWGAGRRDLGFQAPGSQASVQGFRAELWVRGFGKGFRVEGLEVRGRGSGGASETLFFPKE